MIMETKMTLHGPGVYYFAIGGVKESPIFNSVFEFEYGVNALASLPSTRLIAFHLESDHLHCVLRCERDWSEVFDDLQRAFENLHERCWGKRKAILSDQGTVLLIDEQAYLADLVLELHRLPVIQKRVVDASLYPWSSDHLYRLKNPPTWIETDAALNLLCNTRHNRHERYAAVMAQPAKAVLDLQQGNHALYQALARDTFIDRHLKRSALVQSQRSREDSRRLFDDACDLVADCFSINKVDLQDSSQRRQFNRLMPVVVYLLRDRGLHYDDITRLVGEDEDRLQLWLRNLKADHAPALLNRIMQRWSPTPMAMSELITE
ncbi:MAG: hypothetical protein IBX52_07660 [Bacterioplanes sp.]|nr:hypothetical protein [Bacterioplanes sp.]